MPESKIAVIVGAQWGDEGKGKITHFMAEKADCTARFAGGNNAGHTIIFEDRKYKLHHIPSGIFFPQCVCIMGNGMVVDPIILSRELDYLEENSVSAQNLKISDRAHIIMPYHRYMDGKQEKGRKDGKLGTTGRGIGPVYTDKAARTGIRAGELLDEAVLEEKLNFHLREKSAVLEGSGITERSIMEELKPIIERLRPMICDTSILMRQCVRSGKNILMEGAQGALLDLDFGTYPFVTSSSCLAGAAAAGTGVAPWALKTVIGITKAYTTRVGTGPFPTELSDETGEYMLKKGAEYGTTTGRPRRCGWLDLPLLRFAVEINGITSLALTKLDVLGGLPRIQAAVAYELDGKRTEEIPSESGRLDRCKPIYREFEGWEEDISSCRHRDELPENARKYVQAIEEFAGVPVSVISVGGDRDETIIVHPGQISFA